MAKKEIKTQFKIMAPGWTATPAPPLGPVLGANGVNPGQFIQQFNAKTAALKGKIVGCVITVYTDKSFAFEVKSSPDSVRSLPEFIPHAEDSSALFGCEI